ncbi:MAG: nucleotidyltransferase domain-containing protein [Planctomycetota bacterium]|nr:nucleotidyltransferase domain-containing protein [Planctomycetota bacterium]
MASRRNTSGNARNGCTQVAAYRFPRVTSEMLQDLVRGILRAGNPLKIVLFGSRARGRARADSDLDLLIVERSRLPRHKRSPKYYHVASEFFPSVDIVVWSPSEIAAWAGVANHFVTTALREGKVLYEHPR